jgi:predicted transglutaminase-like cysteine proteinase
MFCMRLVGRRMRIISNILAFLVLACTFAVPAQADTAHLAGNKAAGPFMRVYGPSLPPYGFVRFCDHNPGKCRNERVSHQRIDLRGARLRELQDVNRHVNHTIKPNTDQELYGVAEYWTLPTTKGDCEDYALLKRQMLLARGWPEGALLLTVVRDERGDGHAVLTIRTRQGDIVSDNKTDKLLAWNETPYQFVMRQSFLNPKNWMRLDPTNTVTQMNMAGMER